MTVSSNDTGYDSMNVPHDTLWAQALETVLNRLPVGDAEWLRREDHQKPFTSTQIFEAVQGIHLETSRSAISAFFARIDPAIYQIASFAKVVNIAVQANPLGAGLLWSSFYLLILVAWRTQRSLEAVLDFICELGPQLSLFSRWRRLFPHNDFADLSTAVLEVYVQVIEFCVETVRYLKRHHLAKLVKTFVRPSLEAGFRKRESQIKRLMVRVRMEVGTAHMTSVNSQLATIGSQIATSPGVSSADADLPITRLIPHSENYRFFGRQEILDGLTKRLVTEDHRGQRRCALHGSGGSGKTQIAIRFTYEHLDDFRVIIWIMSDSSEKIQQSFRDAAELLGLERSPQNVSRAKSFVLQRLACTEQKFLICFDNADNFDLVKDCLPRTNNGTILYTSRDAVSSENVATQALHVPAFTHTESLHFLKSALPSSYTSDMNEDHLLQRIGSALHGYPLALSSVAGFIRSGGCTLASFLSNLEDERGSSTISCLPLDDYHTNLAAVWNLCFSALGSLSKSLLFVLAFLDPDRVPYELFQDRTDGGQSKDLSTLVDLADDFKFGAAIKGLRSQSLIEVSQRQESSSVLIHRYIQDRAFDRLCDEPDRGRQVFYEALTLLTRKQPKIPNLVSHWSPECWRDSELCQPHTKRLAAKYLASPGTYTGFENDLSSLIYECAGYEFQTYNHQTASETFALAREVANMASSPDSLLISDTYRMEGRMYSESGEPAKAVNSNLNARAYLEQATAQRALPSDDTRLPRILTGLGNSLNQQGKLDEALDLQVQAMSLVRDRHAQQSDAATVVQMNWGFLLCRRGDLASAERILCAALEAKPDTPPAMYALGNTYLAQKRVAEALAVHLGGLQIYKKNFGDEHALVGRCTYKIGEILFLQMNDPAQAIQWMTRAAEICRKQSPYYRLKGAARTLRMLGKAYQTVGDDSAAGDCFEEAWGLREEYTGVRGTSQDTDEMYDAVLFYWDR